MTRSRVALWYLFKGQFCYGRDSYIFLWQWCHGMESFPGYCRVVTRICHRRAGDVCINSVIIGLGYGLSPVWRQAITRSYDDVLWTESIVTDFSETEITIQQFPPNKLNLKMSFAKFLSFCHLYISVQIEYFPRCQVLMEFFSLSSCRFVSWLALPWGENHPSVKLKPKMINLFASNLVSNSSCDGNYSTFTENWPFACWFV